MSFEYWSKGRSRLRKTILRLLAEFGDPHIYIYIHRKQMSKKTLYPLAEFVGLQEEAD